MIPGRNLKATGIVILSLLFFSPNMDAQRYGFRHYGTEYGIPDGFVYSISQGINGFLWIGTGSGLAKFDGYAYYMVNFPDSVESRNVYVSYTDKKGNIWFGCNDGTVFYTDGNELKQLGLKNSRSISQILQDEEGKLYIVPQGRAIFRFSPEDPEKIEELLIPEEYLIFSAAFASDGMLLAGSQGNLIFMEPRADTILVKDVVEDFDFSAVKSLCTSGTAILIGTEDNGMFILDTEKGSVPERISGHPELASLNVRSILKDGDRIWVSTYGSGVIQFTIDKAGNVARLNRYNSFTGLVSDDVQLVFRDSENNYWFGLFGNGLSMLVSYAFSSYTPGKNDQENNIIYVDDAGRNFILGTPAGYHIFDADKGTSLSFTSLTTALGGANALSYYTDDKGRLWIGTDGYGLFVKDQGGAVRRFFKSGDRGIDEIRDIQMDGRNIWLATTNGLVVLNRENGRERKRFGMNESLAHNSINKILIDSEGALVCTESDRLYRIDHDLNLTEEGCILTGTARNKITAVTKDNSGTIWAATGGNGVFSCKGDSVFTRTRSEGLFNNYCYSILTDSRNNIWIGHEKGLSVIYSDGGIIRSYGPEYALGGICNPGGIFESDGKILFGTTSGIIIYDFNKDLSHDLPPSNNITSIIIDDKEYSYTPVISLPYGKYRIAINYSGINFSNPEKVFYSTFLENFDNDWSNMSTTRTVYYNLDDGRYRFRVTSIDENGYSHESETSLVIAIERPLLKKWWFILLVAVFIVSAVILIIRQRERAHKKLKQYLEDELEKRTNVIMKQMDEIEIQNLEITDSINYAKRIQTSILPDINKLKENFREAFVIFNPRDIVSGDFYWFDKVDEDKFIIVCADSTGHGVPGAFMSMIGSTLLQDIVTRQKITRPSQVLKLLDQQIFSTLNQNVELGVSNDGMDVVVCEFSLKARHLRFASAMRPIILVISGESYYIKGNRSSVGGESVIEKYFDDQEYYLNEGDSIYLFSDGLPDQFGGFDGKKMKIARLKKLIDEIITQPMNEQQESVLKFFTEWKGDYEQVDDVLFMGVRL